MGEVYSPGEETVVECICLRVPKPITIELKERKTGLSHACGNGFMPILELLSQVDELDPNLSDNDGNTPLIFSAQAGHDDVVNYLLHHFRHIKVDICNHLGFTALMKAAIQGRTRCAKHLLFSGANPNRRDHGRGLCAEEWAKFCGRHSCAEAISKYIHSKKYFFKKTFVLASLREKWSSEPDLAEVSRKSKEPDKRSSNWIGRHLSMKRKKRPGGRERDITASLKPNCRSLSSPLLVMTPPDDDENEGSPISSPCPVRRPSCVESVVPLAICRPKRKLKNAGNEGDIDIRIENRTKDPPKITATDFDKEKEAN
ncbi:hypothetical protein CAPTEDRAFT_188646 [Capitella teleta]|uniref:Uncharacterized protein n=1 Tax=Capitella teleta TaxID=283909 RepID=R7UZ39_CAPTE|nr:hypothetical protein CAPTEDRAFT_188646 [Capitella teleta]|eukprot:ELU11838.1 hypothetical protein CAPTEDRAFT_188646 [Capitella teleta]